MYSQVVTHPSTNMAQCWLTSGIRRELVFSKWYGRRRCNQAEVLGLLTQLTSIVSGDRRKGPGLESSAGGLISEVVLA